MDILLFPSCKLYENGKFRLPSQIKSDLLKARYQRVVILAAKDGRCMILPVSLWEKNKQAFPINEDIKYPCRPQALDKTHLTLHLELMTYLNNPQILYIEFKGDHCLILNEETYLLENIRQKKLLEALYENL